MVTTDIRFAPLVDSEVVSTPNGGGYVQQVSKKIIATFDPSGLEPGYTVLHYKWSGLDFGKGGPPDSAQATGVAHSPGSVRVSCEVEIVSAAQGSTSKFVPTTSKPVFVVGGPLSLGVYNGYTGTPSRESGSNSSVYIEYFGFDPTGAVPTGAQNPQHGTVTAFGAQPEGTTYTWSVPDGLKALTKLHPDTSSFNVGATAGSKGTALQVKLTYEFTNPDVNDPVTGTCPDNSDKQITISGADASKAYLFIAHKPDTLADDGNPAVHGPYNVKNGPPSNPPVVGDYGCQMDYYYQLRDDGGKAMGQVYVVERWETTGWGNNSAYIWSPTAPIANGKIKDSFSWWTSAPYPKYPGGGTQTGPPAMGPKVHRYYAATTDTSNYAVGLSGILVKTTTTTYWTDYIDN